jgi:hypothetical protein
MTPSPFSIALIIYPICDLLSTMNWLKNKRKISGLDLRGMLKRIDRAYGLVEMNEKEPIIFQTDKKERLFKVRSTKERDKFYQVDAEIKTCTCPDFNFRFLKCKHIIAAEFATA